MLGERTRIADGHFLGILINESHAVVVPHPKPVGGKYLGSFSGVKCLGTRICEARVSVLPHPKPVGRVCHLFLLQACNVWGTCIHEARMGVVLTHSWLEGCADCLVAVAQYLGIRI